MQLVSKNPRIIFYLKMYGDSGAIYCTTIDLTHRVCLFVCDPPCGATILSIRCGWLLADTDRKYNGHIPLLFQLNKNLEFRGGIYISDHLNRPRAQDCGQSANQSENTDFRFVSCMPKRSYSVYRPTTN